MSNCESCSKRPPEPVPYVVHESDMARQERTIKRLWILLLVLIALLAGSNAAWIYYESQFSVETTSTEIEQDTDGGGNNYVVGGDFNGGDKRSRSRQRNEPVKPAEIPATASATCVTAPGGLRPNEDPGGHAELLHKLLPGRVCPLDRASGHPAGSLV